MCLLGKGDTLPVGGGDTHGFGKGNTRDLGGGTFTIWGGVNTHGLWRVNTHGLGREKHSRFGREDVVDDEDVRGWVEHGVATNLHLHEEHLVTVDGIMSVYLIGREHFF